MKLARGLEPGRWRTSLTWRTGNMVATWPEQLLEPFIGHLGQIRERLEGVRQLLLSCTRYGGSSHPSMWIQLYTSAESWKPRVPRDGTIWLFLLSIPMVVWMELDHYDYIGSYLYCCLEHRMSYFNEQALLFCTCTNTPLISLCIHQILTVLLLSCFVG
jgi:hypothetical protein